MDLFHHELIHFILLVRHFVGDDDKNPELFFLSAQPLIISYGQHDGSEAFFGQIVPLSLGHGFPLVGVVVGGQKPLSNPPLPRLFRVFPILCHVNHASVHNSVAPFACEQTKQCIPLSVQAFLLP